MIPVAHILAPLNAAHLEAKGASEKGISSWVKIN